MVIDYKTGSARSYKNLHEDPLANGTSLQLLLYGLAARQLLNRPDTPTSGSYWFVTRKGGFEPHGYRITPELEAEGLRTVAGIVECIESGLFPPTPRTTTAPPLGRLPLLRTRRAGTLPPALGLAAKTRRPRTAPLPRNQRSRQ